jgi:ORF6N domain
MAKEVVPIERIPRAILVIRGEKVILDSDLAARYGVTTGNLNEAVKRNAERFPADFMFQLDAEEVANLKFQFGISGWGGRRLLPYAFTRRRNAFERIE